MALVTIAIYSISLSRGQSVAQARALTFTTLVIANLGLILANRSWSRTILSSLRSPNAALWWVVGGAAVFLTLILLVPILRDLFSMSSLGLVDVGICIVAGSVSILWFDWLKRFSSPVTGRANAKA